MRLLALGMAMTACATKDGWNCVHPSLRPGLTEAQVRNRLGDPDRKGPFGEWIYDIEKKPHTTYRLKFREGRLRHAALYRQFGSYVFPVDPFPAER